jgi:hypothetical protein
MKRKEGSMMHSVNEDLLDDSVDDNDDLIFEIFEDSVDSEIESEWILIWETYYDDFLDEVLEDEEGVKFVNEKTSRRLLKLVLKIHIWVAKRKLLTLG